MPHVSNGNIVFHHGLSFFKIYGNRSFISQLHQLFCQIRIPAQLLQHKIQLDIMLSGFLQNLLPVGAERIHINHIGIRQYLPASMKPERRIHQRSVFL